jgi:hypothetical protein
MNQDLDKKLVDKYPEIFANRYKTPQESPMCWGFDCGDGWYNIIDKLCSSINSHIKNVQDNNNWLIKELEYRELAANGDWNFLYEKSETYSKWLENESNLKREKQQYLDPLPKWYEGIKDIPTVVVDQVKEKFGTLRFYYSGGDDHISGLVRMAEAMSSCICEECGSSGRIRGNGWVRTLCDAHAQEYNYGDINNDE